MGNGTYCTLTHERNFKTKLSFGFPKSTFLIARMRILVIGNVALAKQKLYYTFVIVEPLNTHAQWGLTCLAVFDLHLRLPYVVCASTKGSLARFCRCTASSEPSLLAYAISTKISSVGSYRELSRDI